MKFILTLFILLISATSFAQREGQNIRDAIEEAMENNEYESAVKMYIHLFECDLGNERFALYYDYSFAQFQLNNFKSSKEYLSKALEIDENNLDYKWVKSSSNFLLSSISSKNGLINEQLKYLLKAIEYEQNSDFLSTLGFIYIKLNEFDNSIKYLNEAIILNTDNAYAYNNRALANIKLGNYEKAKKDIQKSIELDNKNAFVYKNNAVLCFYTNQLESACTALKKAIDLGYSDIDSDTKKIEESCKK